MKLWPRFSLFLLLALFSVSCDDPVEPRATNLVLDGGGIQTGIVGQALDSALRVRAVDDAGRPVAGVAVTFAVQGTGGSVNPAVSTTDGHGVASTTWTMPSVAGVHRARASSAGLDSVVFMATAAAAGPATLVVAGDSQGADIGMPLDSLVVVRVRDAFGNSVPGVPVTFGLTGGGGATPVNVLTDSAGEAATQWTLGGLAGEQSLTVTAATLPPLPVTAFAFVPLRAQRLTVSGQHGCWIDPGATAYCWGANAGGQLGDGLTLTRFGPEPVSGALAFRAIATGGTFGVTGHTCGITSDSLMYCWGTAPYGTSFTPALIDTPARLVRITVGTRHACGLAADGTAYCWGGNENGQLGDGGTTTRLAPHPVAGAVRFRDISAGDLHTCGVSRSGVLYCWGDNDYAQLGNGGGSDQPQPVAIATGVRYGAVVADVVHSCALAIGGGLYCWGNDGRGEVTAGAGSWDPVPTPVAVTTGLSLVAVSLGFERTCGSIADGTTYCWGRNYEFALGDSTYGQRGTPTAVLGDRRFRDVEGGTYTTCGITLGDELYCWGTNAHGALGQPDSTVRLTPVAVVGGITFTQVVSGLRHSCGLDAAGVAYCWGFSMSNPAGHGASVPSATPRPVAGGHTFARLAAGFENTCGLTTGGATYCWGDGGSGQIGDGNLVDRNTPTLVAGGHTFTAITVGSQQACGIEGGLVWCWGNGVGVPVAVPSPVSLTQASAGWSWACGLDAGGAAYCWLGDGNSPAATPVGGGLSFASVSVGNRYACGLTAAGAAYCWGVNQFGQLGDGSGDGNTRPDPVPVTGNLSFTQVGVAPDGAMSCGVALSIGYCWGRNEAGQAGDGTIGGVLIVPTPVAGSIAFAVVAPSGMHTCGLATSGTAYCWGTGQTGALGNGATWIQPVPVRVQ